MNKLERRVVELSYRFKLTHISSCLNTVNIIDEIYGLRADNEPFVLGNGHAGLALYVVLESRGKCDAEEMIKKHGTHPSRDMEHGIYVSSGSLGQAETVAVGFALADKNRKVWLVTSDGACAEGSVHEAAKFWRRPRCLNLRVYVVFNALGAYGKTYLRDMPAAVEIRCTGNQFTYPKWLQGLPGHYLTLTEEQYDELMA